MFFQRLEKKYGLGMNHMQKWQIVRHSQPEWSSSEMTEFKLEFVRDFCVYYILLKGPRSRAISFNVALA